MYRVFALVNVHPGGVTHRPWRSLKIQRSIGAAFVRLGRFQEAIENYESIMDAQPDPQTGCARRFAFYQPHS